MARKQKRIKARRTWNINPAEKIKQKKRIVDEPFDENLYRGQKINEEDLNDLEDYGEFKDFERGLK
jgi:hypothetical protein